MSTTGRKLGPKKRAPRWWENALPVLATITLSILLIGLRGPILSGLMSAKTDLVRLAELRGEIVHLDEVLTMSARMAAATGDLVWKERYDRYVDRLDEAIGDLMAMSPAVLNDALGGDTNQANLRLVAAETRAFELIEQGSLDQADALLSSPGYERDKEIYAAGTRRAHSSLFAEAQQRIESQEYLIALSTLFSLVIATAMLLMYQQARRLHGRVEHQREQLAMVEAERQVERQLRVAREAAGAASHTQSLLLSRFSHELRTPLGIVTGLLESTSADTGPVISGNDVCTLKANAQRLAHVIESLLAINDARSGQLTAERLPICIHRLVEDIVAASSDQAAKTGVKLEVRAESCLPRFVYADPWRVHQILRELVCNALKFTPPGGTVTIEITWDNKRQIAVNVIDTGCGIPAERMENLFEPFHRETACEDKGPASGLGLPVCKDLAGLMGAELSVDSDVGLGTRASLRLNGRDVDFEAATLFDARTWFAKRRETRTAGAPASLDDRRILYAEDAADNRIIVTRMLARSGAKVECAHDGAQAVERIMGDPDAFDLILMDMAMPELDGYQATRLLRMQGYDRPIVALTAHALEGDRERCLAAGCDDYEVKPISMKRLRNACLRHLRN